MNILKKSISVLLALAIFAYFVVTDSYACSRVTYVAKDGKVVTGRTMDLAVLDNHIIKVIKRGTITKSKSTKNPIEWTSKYGIIGVASSITKISFINSAINEKGLEADLLWLAGSNFGEPKDDESTITVEEQLEYILGNFETVDEVVNFVKNSKIRLQLRFKNEPEACLLVHYMVTDKKGNNAIVEYINGEAKIYQQNGKLVMTNDPSYDKMLAVKDYFKEIGIKGSMPGSPLSQARFVYLTGWLEDITDEKQDLLENSSFEEQTVLSILSLMRGVSTPIGITLSNDSPSNSPTLYRTIFDLTNNKFYFESALSFTFIWIDLNKVDFGKNQIFDVVKNKNICGDVTEKLVEVK